MDDAPKISVLTASVRPDGLPMVADCLGRQTFRDIEWLICVPPCTAAPADLVEYLRARVPALRFLSDPPRRPGDFYRLNGAWNRLVAAARADLLVFACDWIHFEPDALELFHGTFTEVPDAVVSSPGEHYRRVINGRPEWWWHGDGRLDLVGEDAKMAASHMELSLAAVPKRLVVAVGGFDELYDTVAANSEKELAMRMAKVGAQFYLGFSVEHRIFSHKKESSAAEWDKKYLEACALLARHAQEIEMGTRLRVPYLEAA